jgi:hypothetical protein
MPSPVVETLAALTSAFGGLGVRYYLFGAQAALLHGASRLTADVDVTVELGERPTSSLVRALTERGLVLRVQDPDFIERTRVLPLVHEHTGMLADVVLSGPGLEEMFLDRAQPRNVEGLTIIVARAEDLIAMKILAGRSKDLDDVRSLVDAQPHLDRSLVRETLRLLEEALDRRDLLPQFEQALARR